MVTSNIKPSKLCEMMVLCVQHQTTATRKLLLPPESSKGIKVFIHLMATNLIQNRVNSNHLQNDKPNHPDIRGLTRNRFSISAADWKIYKSSSMVLIERILVHHVPCFKSLNNVLAKHIQLAYSAEIELKSNIIIMPILNVNEVEYSECVKALCQY